jgi:hypothetical protein
MPNSNSDFVTEPNKHSEQHPKTLLWQPNVHTTQWTITGAGGALWPI